MRKTIRWLGFFVTLLSFACPILRAEPQQFDAPTYQVGDSWTYQQRDDGVTYTMTVSEVRSDSTIMKVSPENVFGGRVEVDRDGNVKGENSPWLSFPLFVGKKWMFERQGQRLTFRYNITVSKITTIETKGGTFEALLLEACRSNTETGFECGIRHWYVPALKRIVKREMPTTGSWIYSPNSNFELVSSTLAGQ